MTASRGPSIAVVALGVLLCVLAWPRRQQDDDANIDATPRHAIFGYGIGIAQPPARPARSLVATTARAPQERREPISPVLKRPRPHAATRDPASEAILKIAALQLQMQAMQILAADDDSGSAANSAAEGSGTAIDDASSSTANAKHGCSGRRPPFPLPPQAPVESVSSQRLRSRVKQCAIATYAGSASETRGAALTILSVGVSRTKCHRLVLVHPTVPVGDRAKLRMLATVVEVSPLKNVATRNSAPEKPNGHSAYELLRLWQLTAFRKVMFIPANTLALKNVDDLLSQPELTVASRPNTGGDARDAPLSVMILEPSLSTFEALFNFDRRTTSLVPFLHDFFARAKGNLERLHARIQGGARATPRKYESELPADTVLTVQQFDAKAHADEIDIFDRRPSLLDFAGTHDAAKANQVTLGTYRSAMCDWPHAAEQSRDPMFLHFLYDSWLGYVLHQAEANERRQFERQQNAAPPQLKLEDEVDRATTLRTASVDTLLPRGQHPAAELPTATLMPVLKFNGSANFTDLVPSAEALAAMDKTKRLAYNDLRSVFFVAMSSDVEALLGTEAGTTSLLELEVRHVGNSDELWATIEIRIDVSSSPVPPDTIREVLTKTSGSAWVSALAAAYRTAVRSTEARIDYLGLQWARAETEALLAQ